MIRILSYYIFIKFYVFIVKRGLVIIIKKKLIIFFWGGGGIRKQNIIKVVQCIEDVVDREIVWVKVFVLIFIVRKMVVNVCGEVIRIGIWSLNLIKECEFYIYVNVQCNWSVKEQGW